MEQFTHYHSQKAQEMRDFAQKATTRLARDEFLKLALEYDDLARLADEEQAPLRSA